MHLPGFNRDDPALLDRICTVAIMIMFMWNPSMKLQLYAHIPQAYQTWPVFSLLLLEELRVLVVGLCSAIPAWVLQIVSIELVNNKLQQLICSMNR